MKHEWQHRRRCCRGSSGSSQAHPGEGLHMSTAAQQQRQPQRPAGQQPSTPQSGVVREWRVSAAHKHCSTGQAVWYWRRYCCSCRGRKDTPSWVSFQLESGDGDRRSSSSSSRGCRTLQLIWQVVQPLHGIHNDENYTWVSRICSVSKAVSVTHSLAVRVLTQRV